MIGNNYVILDTTKKGLPPHRYNAPIHHGLLTSHQVGPQAWEKRLLGEAQVSYTEIQNHVSILRFNFSIVQAWP